MGLGLGLGLAERAVLGGGGAALDLEFTSGALDPRITFTRASTAWAYNSSGVLTSYATNTPRLDYDPVTLAAKGLLIEEARTNLAAGDLTNTTNWPAITTTRASGAAAPDGTTSGVTFTQNASGTASYGFNSVSHTISASTATTASFFVRAGTGTWLRLILSDATVSTIAAQAWFNVSAGTVGTVSVFTATGGTPTGISATITPAGNSWYRCTLTATLATATTAFTLMRMTSADNVSTDAGTKTMSFFGPQIEVGAFATSFISGPATRATDVATIANLTPWFNAVEGTIFSEFQSIETTATNFFAVHFDDGTTSNRMWLWFNTAVGLRGTIITAGVAEASMTGLANPSFTGIAKVAMAYRANDCAVSANGGAAVADLAVVLPTVTTLRLGGVPGSATECGYLRRVRYWRSRLGNSTLPGITA